MADKRTIIFIFIIIFLHKMFIIIMTFRGALVGELCCQDTINVIGITAPSTNNGISIFWLPAIV